jgi:mannose-6-phosphate isomerase-like protein (cupin superfamily)
MDKLMTSKLSRRLLVTGHNQDRRSCVVSDATVSGEAIPGMVGSECNRIWGADSVMRYPDRGEKPNYKGFFPPLAGFRVIEMYLPPSSEQPSEATEAAGKSLEDVAPGLAQTMDPDRPGMHRTASVDMVVIMEGRCVLKLDDGEVNLGAGDLVIESGTIHAWVNPFDKPCRFLAVVVGADNELCR